MLPISISLLLVTSSFLTRLVNGRVRPFVPPPADLLQMEGITMQPQSQAVPIEAALSRTGWTATADTFQAGNPPSNVLDGNSATFWHTEYSPILTQLPHNITIDMKQVYYIDGITYQPRQDGNSNGNIGVHQVLISTNGQSWSVAAYGAWQDDSTTKTADFEPTAARYIRIVAFTEAGNRGPWSSAAEINAYGTTTPPTASGGGKWGPTVNFPLTPVSASVQPTTGNVVAWSSWSALSFGGTHGMTITAVFNPAAQSVTQEVISNTGHDMFCVGISMDVNGRSVVTGGDTSQKTSILDPSSTTWSSGGNLQIPRGYQASATCSDGRIFTIGGSWSGGEGGKNGEIFDPNANTWTLLPGCPVAPMLTADAQGVFRADNHGWLFAWKGQSIFQAGPSKAMNWYGTSGTGSQQGAGTRASDADSMCGNAVMYDAVNGKILTVGGSPSYQNAQASSAAHLITLGNANTTPTVQTLNNMNYARIFANAVVLPDGQVFITGGQTVGAPFADTNVQYTPELWNPTTKQFTKLIPNSTPRVYHSWALLLTDGTVLSGGGGLCGTCSTNHLDAQIFTPPYLLNPDKSPASRPVINSVSPSSVAPGATITVQTNSGISAMSLVRYGSSTHTVDTDQRRIPLTFTISSGFNTYKAVIPSDSGIALLGYWMLFVMDGSGHPSVAKTIKIT